MPVRILLIVLALIAIVAILAVLAIAFVTQPFVRPVRSQPLPVSPDRLKAHVRHLSVDLYPRSHDRLRNIELAAQYILSEFRAAGGVVSVQDVVVEGVTYRNIIARYGPASSPTSDPVLVIGAHYDSHGDEEAGANHPAGFSPETHTPGADDNASGVAGLLELARLLGQKHPERPVELVAYTLEEPPHFRTEHMGSVHHARALSAAGTRVRLMLALEMIGYFSDEPGSQHYPLPGMGVLYPDRGNYIALVGKLSDFGAMRACKGLMAGATGLPVLSVNAPATVVGIDLSDHRSYWQEGFPALMITDTAFLRNRNYHEAEDTYEKLDYRRMAQVVQAVHAIALQY